MTDSDTFESIQLTVDLLTGAIIILISLPFNIPTTNAVLFIFAWLAINRTILPPMLKLLLPLLGIKSKVKVQEVRT